MSQNDKSSYTLLLAPRTQIYIYIYMRSRARVCVCVCVCVCVWARQLSRYSEGYGPHGSGSNPVSDEIFRPSRPALWPTQPLVKWVPGLSRE